MRFDHKVVLTRVVRRLPAAAAICCVLTAQPAVAQQTNEWEVVQSPLYLWMTELSGQVGVGNATVPVFLEFADALDSVAGAFSFHFEARKGRWGVLSDLNFVRLSTEATVEIPGPRTVEAEFEFDNTIFEIGASYLVAPARNFSVIGGLRTYTVSPKLQFTGPNSQLTPIDVATRRQTSSSALPIGRSCQTSGRFSAALTSAVATPS